MKLKVTDLRCYTEMKLAEEATLQTCYFMKNEA